MSYRAFLLKLVIGGRPSTVVVLAPDFIDSQQIVELCSAGDAHANQAMKGVISGSTTEIVELATADAAVDLMGGQVYL